MNCEELEYQFEYPLPDWAIEYNVNREVVLGAQLCTKDGRVMGNAVIYDVNKVKARTDKDCTFLYSIITDRGNTFKLFADEITECFWVGGYIMDVNEAYQSRIKS